jgi:hypothetical protein
MYKGNVVPYTTKTGLQIGCMYQPKKYYPMSRDMERLQTSLLYRKQVQKPGLVDRIRAYVNRRVDA